MQVQMGQYVCCKSLLTHRLSQVGKYTPDKSGGGKARIGEINDKTLCRTTQF